MKIFLRFFFILSVTLLINGCNETSKTPQANIAQRPESGWQSGFGQGSVEYFVKNGLGNEIYIYCSDDKPAGVSATLLGKEPDPSKGEKLIFIIDSIEYESEYKNDACRVCAENFGFFWDKLRNAKSLSIKFSQSVKSEFSVNNLRELLPALEQSNCNIADQM
jgi:hypothetical protein